MPVWVTDVSEHQHRPRFRPLWEEGYSGAGAKMTEGVGYADPDGVDNLRRIITSDMIPLAYHFLWGGMSARRQARFFHEQIAKVTDPAFVLPAVDVELSRNMSRAQWPTFADVRVFLKTLEELVPPDKRLAIYSGYYWRDHMGNPRVADLGLRNDPLIWDAHYFTTVIDYGSVLYESVPASYWGSPAFGGEPAQLLQFASTGRTSQYVGDVNAWNGTWEGLHRIAGGRHGKQQEGL